MRTIKGNRLRTVYKLVNQDYYSGTLYSGWIKRSLRRTYERGVKTKPKIGKLFAFRTWAQADNYNSTNGRFILVCKALISRRQPCRGDQMLYASYLPKTYKQWWKRPFTNGDQKVPSGTVLCDWIMPLKKGR